MANNQQICYTNVHKVWNWNSLLAFFCYQITEKHYFIKLRTFKNKDPDRKIALKNAMRADVEIITEESALLQQFFRNITKMMNNG